MNKLFGKRVLMTKAKALIIINIIFSLLFVASSFGQSDDPLDDEFYSEKNLTTIEQLQRSVDKGVNAIERGVNTIDNIQKIQINQAELRTEQYYLKQGVERNTTIINEHSKQIKDVSVALRGMIEAVSGLKENVNWLYALLAGVPATIVGAVVTWFLKGRTKKNV